jgi:hypothetical protein
MRILFGLVDGISNRDGQSSTSKQRDVRYVVTDITHGIVSNPLCPEDLVIGPDFDPGGFVQIIDSKIADTRSNRE